MFGGPSNTKLPHGLRIVILLLRVVLGLTFFYLGFTSLFNPQLGLVLQGRSVPGLYAWVNGLIGTVNAPWLYPVAQWAFLAIGALLVLGLFTRLASLAAIVLLLASYLPGLSMSYTISSIAQFINDELIIILCLLVLIASKAGRYIGFDSFFHFSFRKKRG